MKRIKNKKVSLFNKYLLLYFITAFIPAITACGSLFFSYRTLKEEVIRSNQTSVQLIQQALDTKIRELDNTLQSIAENSALTRYSLMNSSLNAIDSLKEIISLQDFLGDIIITVRNEDDFHSSIGKFDREDIVHQRFMKNLTQNGYSTNEWIDIMHSVTTTTYWPVNAFDHTPDYLYLFSPVYPSFEYSDQNTSRTVALLIKQEFILDLFRSSQTTIEESILLLNSDFELLSHLSPQASKEDILEICEYLQAHPEAVQEGYIKLNNDNLLFLSKSDETDLYYVRFLPEQTAFRTIYSIRTYTLLILALVVIVGILLILFGMRYSYAPIRALADWVHSNQPANTEIGNELTFLKQSFDDAFAQNASLSQTIDNSKHGLIDHLLTALICGNFSTEENFQNACRNLSIRLDQKFFSVCSMLIEENINAENRPIGFEDIRDTIHNNLPDSLQIQIKDLLFAGKLLLVLNSSSDDPVFYHTAMTDVKNRLLEQKGLLTSIGMGEIYDSYEKVGKSYLESVNALDYRLIYGKDCLITPDMYNDHLSEISYPTADLELLHSALLSHNADMATIIINRIKEYTKSKNCSLHAAKYICYDTFSILKKMPVFTNVGYSNTLSQNLNITHLTSFDTIDEFFVSLLEIVQNTIGSDHSSNDFASRDVGQQLIHYIESNCFHYDFQISSMAEQFNITPQYMRKLFKNHTGIGLSDYIATMKLEKAMQLLRDTDMNLNDIVIEIGNTDVSGFIRFFKKGTGLTPGQYRKLNQIQDK